MKYLGERSVVTFRVPTALFRLIKSSAEEENLSVNAWIMKSMAAKVEASKNLTENLVASSPFHQLQRRPQQTKQRVHRSS